MIPWLVSIALLSQAPVAHRRVIASDAVALALYRYGKTIRQGTPTVAIQE